jgi:hypothetical protein
LGTHNPINEKENKLPREYSRPQNANQELKKLPKAEK